MIVFDYVMETPRRGVHESFFFALDSQTLRDPRSSSLRETSEVHFNLVNIETAA